MLRYVLKNKDEPVLAVKTEENRFVEITDIYAPELVPLGTFRDGEVTVESLSEWWQNMSVPGTRDNLRLGLECLNGKSYGDGKKRWKNTEQVRFMGLGLSLNNHYWLEPDWNRKGNAINGRISITMRMILHRKWELPCLTISRLKW